MKKVTLFIVTICCIFIVASKYYHDNQELVDPRIDPILKPFVDEWKADCKEHGINIRNYYDLSEIIVDPNISKIGHCSYLYATIRIKLVHRTGEPLTSDEIKIAVYHELGHYVFKYGHVDGENIMGANLLAEYKKSWTQLKTSYFQEVQDKYRLETN